MRSWLVAKTLMFLLMFSRSFSDRKPIKVCINSPRIGKIDLLCLVVFIERASYSSKLSKTDMYVSDNKLTSTCKLLNVSRYPVIFEVRYDLVITPMISFVRLRSLLIRFMRFVKGLKSWTKVTIHYASFI